MNLEDKVKLLKEDLKKLDVELKKIESAWFQSIDSFDASNTSSEK
ncbi:hypothetical protein [Candidatus Nitrosopumilus sp. SW]|nr:hypothetical protein [Candidatus Nitrosopumilus sp. SW]